MTNENAGITVKQARTSFGQIEILVRGLKVAADEYIARFGRDYSNAVYGGHIWREWHVPEGERMARWLA